jgi:flagellin
MTDIILSSGVRGNLLSLQNTARLLERTQERLATGLKVNSALDDPTAFFTSASLNNRAADLSRLLDSISLGVQTLEAADVGIKAITDLLETAQASARQALQAPGPLTPNTAATVTGTGASVAADAAAVATGSVTTIAADAAAVITGSVSTLTGTDTLASLNFADGDTVTITSTSGGTTTFTVGTAATDTVADLVSALDANTGVGVALTGGAIVATAIDTTETLTFGEGGTGTNLGDLGLTTTAASATNTSLGAGGINGEALTFTTAAGVSTVTFGAANDTRAEVLATLNGGASGLTFSFTGNALVATAPNAAAGDITVTGGTNALAAVGFTASQVANVTNATLGAITQGDTLTINIGGNTQTVTFGNGSGEVDTLAELNTRLAAIQTSFGGTTVVSVDASGNLTVTAGNTTDTVTLGGTATLTTFGTNLTTTAIAPPTGSAPVDNVIRAKAETDYNELLTQITELARDASFNGNNLLQNDNLTIFFNENSTSSLTITGVDFDSGGLGLSTQASGAFQTNSNINTALAGLETAILQIRTQAGTFGSNLSVVETRQQFTSSLIKTLETGGADLVLADINEEGANLLALQTRQQLSSTALSLASQADQNVLRLFG